jgi:hypothetical protein
MISGFWPRATLVRLPPREAQSTRPPGRFVTEPHIVEKLRDIAGRDGREVDFKPIDLHRQAYASWLYQEAAELDNPNLATGYCRLEWILVKIAALLELADNPQSKQIEMPAFNDAVTLIEYVRRQMPEFYSEHMRPDEETKIAEWALRFIKKHDQNGTLWVPYGDILRSASQYARSKLSGALQRLVETDEIQFTPILSTNRGGRPGIGYMSNKK